MLEIRPTLYFLAILASVALVSLNGGQRCTDSGRKPERDDSSGQPSSLAICTAVQIAKELGWPLESSRSGFLPESVQRWPPFKETNATLAKIAKKHSVGLISNIDDKLLGQTRRHIPTDFDLVVTAQQVRSYKPDPAHFTECERRIGGKKGWVHIAASYYHDIEPCLKKKIPVIWVNRTGQVLESSQKKPDAEVKTLREAAKLIGVG